MKRASVAIAAVALVASTFGLASEVAGQEPARFPRQLIPRVSVAGALDVRSNKLGDHETYFGLGALEWDTKVNGLAFRLDGLYARRDWGTQVEPLPDAPPMFVRFAFQGSKATAAGALAGLTYDLRQRGAFRPYVLASAGLLQTNDRVSRGISFMCTGECVTIASSAPAVTVQQQKRLTGAAQMGAGIVYSFPWVSLFADARYMTAGYSKTRALNGAVPVSLGVRFGRR